MIVVVVAVVVVVGGGFGGGGGGVDGVSRGPRENRAAGRRPIICTHSTRASSALS